MYVLMNSVSRTFSKRNGLVLTIFAAISKTSLAVHYVTVNLRQNWLSTLVRTTKSSLEHIILLSAAKGLVGSVD